MNNLTKFILKLCFGVWLISSIIPESIQMDYKVIFLIGKITSGVVFVLALIAFLIPLLQKKQQITESNEKTRLILHDLDAETAESLFKNIPNTQVFSARKKMAKCCGCFGCWLKSPGICIMHDGTESFGTLIAGCDEFIIISKNVYGGLSTEIKNVLDRSISLLLPFFKVRNREQHHQMRYAKIGKLKVYIYHSDEISDVDKATLTEITRANGINMDKSDCETVFIHDVQELQGALA